MVGKNQKSEIKSLKFNQNEVTDKGLLALLKAIGKKENLIKELSFVQNQITDEGANIVCNWLQRQRMRKVANQMNIVTCDLSMNKVLHKSLKEVEA